MSFAAKQIFFSQNIYIFLLLIIFRLNNSKTKQKPEEFLQNNRTERQTSIFKSSDKFVDEDATIHPIPHEHRCSRSYPTPRGEFVPKSESGKAEAWSSQGFTDKQQSSFQEIKLQPWAHTTYSIIEIRTVKQTACTLADIYLLNNFTKLPDLNLLTLRRYQFVNAAGFLPVSKRTKSFLTSTPRVDQQPDFKPASRSCCFVTGFA